MNVPARPKDSCKKRIFSTRPSPTISTSRPRDSASVFQKQIKAFIPIPTGIDIETLEDTFKPLSDKISLYSAGQTSSNENELKTSVKANIDAVRSVGANVLAFWSKNEIGSTGWRSGKQIRTIQ